MLTDVPRLKPSLESVLSVTVKLCVSQLFFSPKKASVDPANITPKVVNRRPDLRFEGKFSSVLIEEFKPIHLLVALDPQDQRNDASNPAQNQEV